MWDHRLFYVLSEVHWRTGRAMYGDLWTGYETTYGPESDLSALRQQQKNAAREFDQQLGHAKFLRMHYPENASDAEYLSHQKDIKSAETASAAARTKRDQLSEALRGPEQNQAGFERGASVQRRLVRAFSRGELALIFGTGMQVNWDEWARHSTFRVSFAQSLIYAPSDLSSIRRATGFVERKAFDDWHNGPLDIEVRLAKREGPEQFADMRDWFLNWITVSPQKPNKDDGEHLFQKTFSPNGKTTFSDLWRAYAPDSWRQRGRPKS
ncbi:hypothetical protein K3758_05470 [Sulfitobacter sp. W002]|uniref:hypothetical protein n=1 Tax=Sulfitobacter sp. W002 TaxID=2867024 RepID=UPI0021A3F78A|nr:hypothetical protein [Sulfitobacter sp. W002]UWR30978.1 hypothetical protein K3758_05470 [Sulfitobacter sp. W002]